jgi:hypothetical protein
MCIFMILRRSRALPSYRRHDLPGVESFPHLTASDFAHGVRPSALRAARRVLGSYGFRGAIDLSASRESLTRRRWA